MRASGGELFAKSSAKIFGLWFYENYIFSWAVVSTQGRSKALRELPHIPKILWRARELFLLRKVLEKYFS